MTKHIHRLSIIWPIYVRLIFENVISNAENAWNETKSFETICNLQL